MLQRRLLVLTTILLFAISLCAQNIEFKRSFQNLTVAEGLISNQTNSAFQDSRGFIWITQIGGIIRYDGLTCKTFAYDDQDSTMLQSPLISCVTEDKNGNMWFGTLNAGLVYYNRQTETFTHYNTESKENPLPSNVVRSVITDHNGDVWFALAPTSYGRVDIPDENVSDIKINIFQLLKGKLDRVTRLFQDSQNRIWLSGLTGLFVRYPNGKTHQVDAKRSIGANEDKKGNIFSCNALGDLLWVTNSPEQPDSLITHIIEPDSAYKSQGYNDSYLFVFTHTNQIIGARSFQGLFVGEIDLEKKQLHIKENYQLDFTDPKSLMSNSARDIFIDKTGVVWISTPNAGMIRFDLFKKQFLHLKQSNSPKGLKSNTIERMYEDKHHNLWIASQGSPLLFLPKFTTPTHNYENFSPYGKDKGFTVPRSLSLCETEHHNRNTFWVGSWHTFRITDYAPEKNTDFQFEVIRHRDRRLPTGMYWCMLQTTDKRIWYGQYDKGFVQFDLDAQDSIINIQQYRYKKNKPRSISSNTVRCINQVRNGDVWLGTANGLNKAIPNKSPNKRMWFKIYQKNNKKGPILPHNYIIDIYESENGTLWLASLGGGLIKADRNKKGNITKFTQYSLEDGMPSKMIKGITEDAQGNLWLGSDNGLIRFTPSTEKIKVFTQEDGLQSDNFCDNSFLKRKSGEMLFGGFDGVTIFYPDSIHDNTSEPQIAITDFKIFGKSIKVNTQLSNHTTLTKPIVDADTVTVTYQESVLEFEFAALHYAVPQKNQLKYRLTGFDQDWVTIQKGRNFASYTNLNGGTYTFEVKGSNNDGLWNSKIRSITLIVIPPWWETLLFKILLSIFIISASVGYYLYRMRAIKAENERLEQLVTQRTNKLSLANAELTERQEEILVQKKEIEQQAEELKSVNDDMSHKNVALEEQQTTILRSFENIKRLGDFGQQVTAILNQTDITKMMNEYLHHFMETTSNGLGLYSEKRGQVVYRNFNHNGQLRDTFGSSTTKNSGLSALSVLNNQEIISGNVTKDYTEYLIHSPEIDPQSNVRSVLYQPLIANNKVLGVITVQHQHPNAFNEQQQSLLRNLATYLSIAISNAKSYEIIEQKNTDIGQSLNYAQTIQQAILPLEHHIQRSFNHFTIFKPKDVVSGDFYWYAVIERTDQPDLRLFAVIDCTGHGVPGAIMSIVSNGALNRIVHERNVTEPAAILEDLDTQIRSILKQDQNENKDGMDVCLCSFTTLPTGQEEMHFSASKRSLYLFNSAAKELEIIKGTRRYIGGIRSNNPLAFKTEIRQLSSNDVVYLSSDGFVDQNSVSRERYGSKRFHEILKRIGALSMTEQHEILLTEFHDHKQREKQRDDVTLVGLQIK